MKRGQVGLSLVELMIAMVIGLILLTGVVHIFLGSKHVYTTQDALSRIQENGRLAVDFISRDARMAGYAGCAGGANSNLHNGLNVSPTNAGDKLLFDFEMPIEGLDNVGVVPGWGAGVAPVAGTDVMFIRGAFAGDVGIKANNSSGNLRAETNSPVVAGADGGPSCAANGSLCENDIVMISDCSKSRVFQVTNLNADGASAALVVHAASGTPGNASPASWGGASAPPEEVFGVESELLRISSLAYFIGVNPAGRRALYQRAGTAAAVELVEGIQDMQITFGYDTSGDGVPDSYAAASAISNADRVTHVANWAKVISVRVALLLQSNNDNILETPQEITFNGSAVNPSGGAQDRRLRQVFVSTIGIRSRLD
jgi:type IV pilus assembly protein PilW